MPEKIASDQIRRLRNVAELSGILATLENVREGKTEKGIPYISFNGSIQCHPTEPIYTIRFRTFVQSKKKDMTDNKIYHDVVSWVRDAIPKSDERVLGGECEPTMVHAVGSITDAPFVNKDGELIKNNINYNMTFFNDFDDYQCGFDIEGYLASIKDETIGENADPTGRSRLRIISRDGFGNILDLNQLVADAEATENMNENGYEAGVTAIFSIDLKATQSEQKVRKGGFGKVRHTNGGNRLEMCVVGGEPPYEEDSEKAISSGTAKEMLKAREAVLTQIQAEGYKGNANKTSSKHTSPAAPKKSGTMGKTRSRVDFDDDDVDDAPPSNFVELDEDEIPF